MECNECDTCWYYDYDEEFDEYYCMMDLDEDEVYRFLPPDGTAAPITGRETTIRWQEDNDRNQIGIYLTVTTNHVILSGAAQSAAKSKNPFSLSGQKGTDPSTSLQNPYGFFHFAQDDSVVGDLQTVR